ncbi:hypothetical protein [Pectobacterium phage Wc4-1]|uniref:Uncharacterized protein n=1 Tax=Pectobacterium phage Wc4 TaxID=2652428 RepID=A0A5P8D4C1_9CAUD|nr:hypothetical protein [Pectobacterium phage Wc4]QFP93979.1 hypothetical protein [Pectobacterium phage Wc4-1]
MKVLGSKQNRTVTIDGAVFEYFTEDSALDMFASEIQEKVRQFALAIKEQHGYHVVLRKQTAPDGSVVLYADIREARQSYVFIIDGLEVSYQICKEVF